jgi:hypothetical protein
MISYGKWPVRCQCLGAPQTEYVLAPLLPSLAYLEDGKFDSLQSLTLLFPLNLRYSRKCRDENDGSDRVRHPFPFDSI